jgi:phosphatidylserine/phosphatidylglycerophosphate/cardiolipin synthase-like enzyme
MRKIAEANGVVVKAYAGTTGVLLAMNLKNKPRKDFLGWAIEKKYGMGKEEWLSGMIPFPHVKDHEPGALIPSNVAPLQKFRWSDYGVHPETRYKYVVHPVFGDPKSPTIEDGPAITIQTEAVEQGDQCVLFNRAAAASQAFARKFQTVTQKLDAAKKKTNVDIPPEALVWLSRGLKEAIVQFIESAKGEGSALDVAIYQYEQPEIVDAVNAALKRGVDVRVVYHSKKGDKQTGKNEESLKALPKSRKRARDTSKIFHHKFIVLSKVVGGKREPRAVLCGSTNFTHNGVYRQANQVHILRLPDVATKYESLFGFLFGGADPAATREFINTNCPILADASLYVGFSPRSKRLDLAHFINLIDAAKRDVLFATTFSLFTGIKEALLGKPHDSILRYGLQDKSIDKMTGVHADRTADFEATALLPDGLEGFIKESLRGDGGTGNILIHVKIVVVDFTSDSPTVISGSHNFSEPASSGNDENFLVIKGDTSVADTYACEIMRLYDHYRFRFRSQQTKKAGKKLKPLKLKTDNSWTEPYYKPDSLQRSDRILFSGGKL